MESNITNNIMPDRIKSLFGRLLEDNKYLIYQELFSEN